MKNFSRILFAGLSICTAHASAEDLNLTIDAAQPAGKVSPKLYGLMTEEINHSYDGGLYAELIRNRAFLDAKTPVAWSLVTGQGAEAKMALDSAQPFNTVLTNSLRLDVAKASPQAHAGVANDGYWGIPVKPHTTYRAAFCARTSVGAAGPVTVSIESDDGKVVFARSTVSGLGQTWKQYHVKLKTGDVSPTTHARLVLSVERPGTVWLNFVSLFPPTWHRRGNGNREDIMQLLSDMKPAFLRFPGGNYVEGDTVATRFDWKKTIGPVAMRPGHPCPWGYRSSDGLGLLEFLEWCEDLKMEPVLAVYAGYSLRGDHINPGPDLEPFVQDALDEIQYVTGDTATKWGARRAKDGHPEPFPLTYVEIGNEDWFDRSGSYDGRFAQFYDAIKARYPRIQCISTIGNEHPDQKVQSREPDVLDEHYYSSAKDYDQDWAHFDKYERKGPKIFVGEWAAYEDIKPWEGPSQKLAPTPALKSALADAAWMAGMERNSDLIVMQCYAPLFVNVNPAARQWRPNLIGYNGLSAFGSPSYYAIQLFSQNHGTSILKASLSGADPKSIPPLHCTATGDDKRIFLKVVNTQPTARPVQITISGVKSLGSKAKVVTLSGKDPTDTNSIDEPHRIVPVESKLSLRGTPFSYTFPPYSISVLELNMK